MLKIIKSRNLYIDKDSLVLVIPEIKMENLQDFGMIICQNFPENCDENYKVIIKNGDKFIYLKSFSGNYIRADQLRKRTYYPIRYGVDPIHISIMKPIINTKFQYNLEEDEKWKF